MREAASANPTHGQPGPFRVRSGWRVACAFLLAPMVVTIALTALPLMDGASLEYFVATALLCTYPAALLLGAPLYVVLRRRRPTLVKTALAGTLVELAWTAYITTHLGFERADGPYTLGDFAADWRMMGAAALSGALGGAAFWLIALAPWPRRRAGQG